MKRILTCAIVLCLCLSLGCVMSEAASSGNFTYEIENGHAVITALSDSASGSIEVPGVIGGYPVTEIGDYAFYGCSLVTSVSLPDSIEQIGVGAFYNCMMLERLAVPDGVTKISDDTFYGCIALKDLSLPQGITAIGARAFAACRSLTSFSMPEEVTSIGAYAFYGCGSLTEFTFSPVISEIGTYAFCECDGFKEFTLPESVKKVGAAAFSSMGNLTTFYWNAVNASVDQVGLWARTDLRHLVTGENVEVIPPYAFFICQTLEIVEVKGATMFSHHAFASCDSLCGCYVYSLDAIFVDDVFIGDGKLVFYVRPDSGALQFAKVNRIPYKYFLTTDEYAGDALSVTVTGADGGRLSDAKLATDADATTRWQIGSAALSDKLPLTLDLGLSESRDISGIRLYSRTDVTGEAGKEGMLKKWNLYVSFDNGETWAFVTKDSVYGGVADRSVTNERYQRVIDTRLGYTISGVTDVRLEITELYGTSVDVAEITLLKGYNTDGGIAYDRPTFGKENVRDGKLETDELDIVCAAGTNAGRGKEYAMMKNVVDGDLGSWSYINGQILVDLGDYVEFSGFRYYPPKAAENACGMMPEIGFYRGDLLPITDGEAPIGKLTTKRVNESFTLNAPTDAYGRHTLPSDFMTKSYDTNIRARYIWINSWMGINGANAEVSIGELKLLKPDGSKKMIYPDADKPLGAYTADGTNFYLPDEYMTEDILESVSAGSTWDTPYVVTRLTDGDTKTYWHSATGTLTDEQRTVTMIFTEPVKIGGVRMYPRDSMDFASGAGRPALVTLQGSTDGTNFFDLASNDSPFTYTDKYIWDILIPDGAEHTLKAIRYVVNSSVNGNVHTHIAELRVLLPDGHDRAFLKALEEAEKELDGIDRSLYREAEKTELEQLIRVVMLRLNKLKTASEITEEMIAVRSEIQKIKTDAELTEEEEKRDLSVSIRPTAGGSVKDALGATRNGTTTEACGTELKLTQIPGAAGSFKAWLDTTTGKRLSSGSQYGFTVYSDRAITALFSDHTAADDCLVSFVNRGDQFVLSDYVKKGSDASAILPSALSMYSDGYAFTGFEKAPGTVSGDTEYTGVYEKKNAVYRITVTNGTNLEGESDFAAAFDSRVTVTANEAPAGMVFAGWEIGNKRISYKPRYSFYVYGSVNIRAVYEENVSPKPIITMLRTSKDKPYDAMTASFTTAMEVPVGYTYIESGMIYAKTLASKDDLKMTNIGKTVKGKTVKRVFSSYHEPQFKLTARYGNDGISVRGYLIYLDENGAKKTVYTDVLYIAYSVMPDELEEAVDTEE